MEKKIGIIGHIDHGKTTLNSTIAMAVLKETKTIHEIIEESKSIPFTAPQVIDSIDMNVKTGKENRRERRAKERKFKQHGNNK